jgi:DeoR family suf operon transcriptional repressor
MRVQPAKHHGLKGTRGRVVDLLRRSAMTANEIATQLELTHNAVRSHLATLRHDGLVREGGFRRSGTRPAVVYELVPGADSVLSTAYVPFVAQLLRTLGERLSRAKLDELMRAVGRGLAAERPRVRGDLRRRVEAAAVLLEDLGALVDIEEQNGDFVLRGHGCLLAEAVHGRPEVCRAMESLLAELLEVPVRECCERNEHPRCCFAIARNRGALGATRRGVA